jgi:hypothetical protein
VNILIGTGFILALVGIAAFIIHVIRADRRPGGAAYTEAARQAKYSRFMEFLRRVREARTRR